MFMQHHCVRIPVELLKTETTIVLALDLLDCVFQKIPNAVHIFLIHSHLEKETRYCLESRKITTKLLLEAVTPGAVITSVTFC